MYIHTADGLLQEENEDREGGNSYEMGSRDILENFTPSDPDMSSNGPGTYEWE